MEKTLTIPGAQKILGRHGISNSVRTIKKLIYDKKITASKINGKHQIERLSLEKYISTKKGIDHDWFIAVYVRTSSLKDPGMKKLIKARSILWPFVEKKCEEFEIPLIHKSGRWGLANVRYYSDGGSVNENKPYDLPGIQDLYRDAALGFAGNGPKMKHLFMSNVDRWHKGDIRTWTQWCRAIGIEFHCKDLEGLSDKEIEQKSDLNALKAKLERELSERIDQGKNLSNVEREKLFKPVIDEARRLRRHMGTKGKARVLVGLIRAYDEGTNTVKFLATLKRVVEELDQ